MTCQHRLGSRCSGAWIKEAVVLLLPGYMDGVCSKLLTSLRLMLAFHTLFSTQNMADFTLCFVKGIVGT